MQTLKKVEIIISEAELPKLTRLIEKQNLHYSLFRHVSGKGDRGHRADDELTGVFANACLMTAIEPEKLAILTDAVRPILKKTGGLCLVSDVQGLSH
jgi:nitrogen regulatory protein PII